MSSGCCQQRIRSSHRVVLKRSCRSRTNVWSRRLFQPRQRRPTKCRARLDIQAATSECDGHLTNSRARAGRCSDPLRSVRASDRSLWRGGKPGAHPEGWSSGRSDRRPLARSGTRMRQSEIRDSVRLRQVMPSAWPSSRDFIDPEHPGRRPRTGLRTRVRAHRHISRPSGSTSLPVQPRRPARTRSGRGRGRPDSCGTFGSWARSRAGRTPGP
jgi:hypothetical protein